MANVSHGRGGAGNIGADSEEYTDAGAVRHEVQAVPDDKPYSTGRGGAGNVASPKTKPTETSHDEDVIPETAMRDANQRDYHIGRGGAGNERHNHPKGEHELGQDHKDEPKHEGLVDKIKDKVLGHH